MLPAWIRTYRPDRFPGDLLAGAVVAMMLVPQAMAYAALAGLPPEVGLYASVLPLLVHAWFASSATLSVGPTAIDSLLVGVAVAGVAHAAPLPEAAAVLALLTGAVLVLLAILRLGALAAFLSHPVMAGFVSAAALVIGLSQVPALLGLPAPGGTAFLDLVAGIGPALPSVRPVTAALGLGTVALLVAWRGPVGGLLRRLGLRADVAAIVSRTGPVAALAVGIGAGAALDLETTHGVATVGEVAFTVPDVRLPRLDPDLWRQLLPSAVMIALVCFVESISVARAYALRRRERLSPDRELFALGVANAVAACTGGYNVAGGLSRTSVNVATGAGTPLASAIAGGLTAMLALALAPLFELLPRATLAAIVIVAVAGLLEPRALLRVWRYDRADGACALATFVAVLGVGLQAGILGGVVLSLVLHVWRSTRPHIAIVGRVGDSEHFRNVRRHAVRTCPHVLAIRIDESLYFANTRPLEELLLTEVADRPALKHVVLVASAVNAIDASALETLENVIERLREAGITFHLSEVKGPVMDRLARSDFLERLRPGQVFLSTHEAMRALDCS